LSNFITEKQLLKAIKLGHDEISKLCLVMEDFQGKFGKKKKTDTLRTIPPSLMENIDKVRNHKKNTNKQINNCLSSSLRISLICFSVIWREDNEHPTNQRETRETSIDDFHRKRYFNEISIIFFYFLFATRDDFPEAIEFTGYRTVGKHQEILEKSTRRRERLR
jgi:hypothetical protein